MKANLTITLSILLFIFIFTGEAQAQTETNKNEKQENNQSKKSEKKPDNSEDCPKSGVVKLRVTFENTGKVSNVEIVQSSGCVFMDEKADEAIRKMKFKPARKDGKNITIVKLVEYTFRLD